MRVCLSSSCIYPPGNRAVEPPKQSRGLVRWENQRTKWETFQKVTLNYQMVFRERIPLSIPIAILVIND